MKRGINELIERESSSKPSKCKPLVLKRRLVLTRHAVTSSMYACVGAMVSIINLDTREWENDWMVIPNPFSDELVAVKYNCDDGKMEDIRVPKDHILTRVEQRKVRTS